jgi:hypothetical protein
LHALPATGFWWARNTLTQRAIGPQSTPTTILDTSGLQPGDSAGLALLNLPYAWIGVRCDPGGMAIEQFNQLTGRTNRAPLAEGRVWLRAQCDFLREVATFSYSTDGRVFQPLGGEFELVFQLKTFQGVRYALFAFNGTGLPGGHADFDSFTVAEPHPHGLMRPITYGRPITLAARGRERALGVKDGALAAVTNAAASRFTVLDAGLGRVSLRADDGRLVSVESDRVTLTRGAPNQATTFQWIENVYGDLMLLSLSTNRYLRIDPGSGAITADHAGPEPDRHDGSCFDWSFSL